MNEATQKTKPVVDTQIVVYSGRFQPFHAGHYAVYKHLVSKFGKNSVYIGSSNDTSGPKSPLTFNEKKRIATEIFDVPKNRFVKVSNPYAPEEILKSYNKNKTQYITVVGEKDSDRLGGKYFKPYKGKETAIGYKDAGYVYQVPPQAGGISATDVRKGITNKDVNKAKAFWKKVFPKYNPEIFILVRNKILKMMNEGEFTEPSVKRDDDVRSYTQIAWEPTFEKKEMYNPIMEVLNNTVSELDFEEFVNNYFNEKKKINNEKIAKPQSKEKEKPTVPSGLVHLGRGYYGKEGGEATHRRDPNTKKIVQLTPDDIERQKAAAAKAAGLPPQPKNPAVVAQKAKAKQGGATTGVRSPTALPKATLPGGAPVQGQQQPPQLDPAQKIKPADMVSPAEKDAEAEAKKQKLQNAAKELDKADSDFIKNNEHSANSKTRKQFKQNIKNGIKKFGAQISKWAHHKSDMVKGTGAFIADGIKATMNDKKMGVYQNKQTGEWEADPVRYKQQLHHVKQFVTDLSVMIASMATGGAVTAGISAATTGAATVGAIGTAAAHGAASVFHHGVVGFSSHFAKDLAKHCALEVLGVNNAVRAGAIATAIGAAHDTVSTLVEQSNGGNDPAKFTTNVMNQVADKMQTHEMTDDQMLKSIESYKKNKNISNTAKLFKEGKESLTINRVKEINSFVEWATKKLNLKKKPTIKLITTDEYAKKYSSLGGFNPESKDILTVVEGRLIADVLRTIAHEMVHRKQDELGLLEKMVDPGKTGSPIENQANAVAGVMLREYGKKNQAIYLNESYYKLRKFKDVPVGAYFTITYTSFHGTSKITYKKTAPGTANIVKVVGQKRDSYGEYQAANGGYRFTPVRKVTMVAEDINLKVNKGDTILTGKFKNKKTKVKDISKDDHDMPTINGRVATTFRYSKEKVDEDFGGRTVSNINMSPSYQYINWDEQTNPDAIVVHLRNHKDLKIYKDTLPGGQRSFDLLKKAFSRNLVDITDRFVRTFLAKQNNPKTHESLNEGFESHALYELEKAGLFSKDSDYEGMIGKAVYELCQTFAKQGHSGFSAAWVRELFNKLSNYETLTPITSNLDEWGDVAEIVGGETPGRLYQNKRNPAIFSEDGGKTWYHVDKKAIKEGISIGLKKFKRQLLTEGGAAGHMAHPFDNMNLTYGDLKNIITGALNGNLGVVKEKLDGQALAISWKNGRLIAARNKSHTKNSGAGAMGIEDVASKFAGRGGLTDAFTFAVRDLSAAISGLSQAQKDKVFKDGKCFMNLEVIWPTSVNVIPYGQAMLVFHGTTEYNDEGESVSSDSSSARMLAGMIKQINAHIQSKYTIEGPPIVDLPKKDNLSAKQAGYLSKLNKLQNKFKCDDKDKVSCYHIKWWADFIEKNSPAKIDKLTKDALITRWAFGDKSFRLNTISNPEIKKWAIENDKVNVENQQKENIKPFEEIFLQVGADVLEFVGSAVTVNPDAALRDMKDRLKSTAAKVRQGGDVSKILKLKSELERLKAVGGTGKIVPTEGIVFTYKGNVYKLTGTFAPLNQILGLFYD